MEAAVASLTWMHDVLDSRGWMPLTIARDSIPLNCETIGLRPPRPLLLVAIKNAGVRGSVASPSDAQASPVLWAIDLQPISGGSHSFGLRYLASGSGRIWIFTTFGSVPLPPSAWCGV